jgi:hypothetical protein
MSKVRSSVPEHLLEDIAELFTAKLVGIFLGLCLSTKAKGAPREAETSSLLVARLWSWDLLFWVSIATWRCVRAGSEARAKARAESVVASCGVVVSSSCRVGEGVVGVVDLLELSGAGGTFRRVVGNKVRMVLQCLSGDLSLGRFSDHIRGSVLLVGSADLVLCCLGVDLQGGVVIYRWC